MPSHISHILIAKEITKKINLNNLDYDYFLAFSLGADLTKYSRVRKLSHKEKQKELIMNMFSYLEEHNLTNDKYHIATIYGHISHMVADYIIHKQIYKETKECPNKSLHNHTYLEAHYDAYLLSTFEHINVNKFSLKKHLNIKVSKVKDMLDYAYYKTYGYKHISKYYKIMIKQYKLLDILFKIFSINFLKNISHYQVFIKDNSIVINDSKYLDLTNKTIETTINYFNYLKEQNININKD